MEVSPTRPVASGPVPLNSAELMILGSAGTADGAVVMISKVVGPVAPSAQPAGMVARSASVNDQVTVCAPAS